MNSGLIIYIGFAQKDEWRHWAHTYSIHSEKLERASGAECLVLPYTLVHAHLIDRLAPDAVILSGFARSFEEYPVDSFGPVCGWLKDSNSKTPTLALCGSHQLLGFLFGNEWDGQERLFDQPMRKLMAGEPITNPDFHPEFYMEKGFYHLELTEQGKQDALFTGCGSAPIVYESHYCEIKRLPADFVLLASTTECRIQAMRHAERPLYGVQFHPEDCTERFPDGMRILENFFRTRC